MPTHQGKSQTDIVVSDGGDSAAEHSEFEYSATYSASGSLQYADLAPNTDRQYSAYELIVTNPATGGVLATMAARYRASLSLGSAKGKKNITITNDFNPNPDGSSPTWPLTYQTSASRVWLTNTYDSKSNIYAKLLAQWDVRTTVGPSSAHVIQTVVDQTPQLLRVHLVYLDGSAVLLDAVVTMLAIPTVSGSITADPPDVTDTFVP